MSLIETENLENANNSLQLNNKNIIYKISIEIFRCRAPRRDSVQNEDVLPWG